MGGYNEACVVSWPRPVGGKPVAGRRPCPGTVKIGLILPYSGQFADTATQIDDGIKLYLKQHGNKLGGMNVEIIRKDVGGIDPPVAKRLAEELVTRDNVDILAGFALTPNALAAAEFRPKRRNSWWS